MAKNDDKTPAFLKEGPGYTDITLSTPAKIAGVEVGTLRMREPTAGDMERFQDMSGSDAKREIDTFAHL